MFHFIIHGQNFVFGNEDIEEPRLTVVCDDNALVDEVNAGKRPSQPVFPNDTLASDYDVIQFLLSLHRKMNLV